MPNHRLKLRAMLRPIGAAALAAAYLYVLAPASAADTPSSPSDRQRVVAIAHKLEQAPLDPALQEERAWAMRWLIDVPDIGVEICADSLPGFLKRKYRYDSEIVAEYSLAMAAFQIEHPESAKDMPAQQLAGIQAVLKAYRAILREDPKAHASALDALLQTEAQGGLADLARKATAACSPHKGGDVKG
jgi:hypothetical protein